MILILILTILSSDGIVSAQEFFAINDNDLITAMPLNKCISKGSNSMIYRFHNGTHAVQKIFTGSTTCDETLLSSQYLYEGYYTDIQRLIDNSIAYRTSSYDATCTENFMYTFFKDKSCLEGIGEYYSITVLEDRLIEIYYQVTNNNMCDYDYSSGVGSVFYENKCVPYGPDRYVNNIINHAKLPQCEENATDEMGIALVFLFICLILF